MPTAVRLPSSAEKPVHADGKRRLIEAALRLCAREGLTLSSLGLRELAREADLNHNTFYRHFDDFAELARAAADEITGHLMSGLQLIRENTPRHADATRGAVEFFLDFVQEHPEPFIVTLRELHNAHSPVRTTLKNVLDHVADESARQMLALNLVPGVDRPTLQRTSLAITHHMLYRALDVIEHPKQRKPVADELVRHIRALFLGTAQEV